MPELTGRGRSLGPCEMCLADGRHDSEAVVVVDGEPLCRFHARAPMEARPKVPAAAVPAATKEADQEANREPDGVPEAGRNPRGELAAPAQKICGRGCGQPSHRGNCPRAAPAAGQPVCRGSVPPTSGLGALVDAVDRALDRAHPVEAAGVSETESRKGVGRMDSLRAVEVEIGSIPGDARTPQRSCGRLGEAWKAIVALPPGKALRIANRDGDHATYTLRQIRLRAEKEGARLLFRRTGTDLYCWRELPSAGTDLDCWRELPGAGRS